jgi:hypothetical protein
MIKDELFLTTLGTNVALEAIDSVLDRRGEGTAWTEISVMGNGLPDFEIRRKNMYYSKSDIAARSIQDLYQMLDLIANNPFKKINLMNITLDIKIVKEDNVALVKKAKILNEAVKPGDTLKLEVTLQPYRSAPFVRELSIELPENIKAGMSNIVISGSYMGQGSQPNMQQNTEVGDYEVKETQLSGYKSFSEMINDYLERPQNNDLVIQVYPGYGRAAVPAVEQKKLDDQDKKETESGPTSSAVEGTNQSKVEERVLPEIKKTITTNYILEGNLNLNIEVEGSNSKEQGSKETIPSD